MSYHREDPPRFGNYPCCGEADEAPGTPWHYVECDAAKRDPELYAYAVEWLVGTAEPDDLIDAGIIAGPAEVHP